VTNRIYVQIAIVLCGDASLAILGEGVCEKRIRTEHYSKVESLGELDDADLECRVAGQSLFGTGPKLEKVVGFADAAVCT